MIIKLLNVILISIKLINLIEGFIYMDPSRALSKKCVFNSTFNGYCTPADKCKEVLISSNLENSLICEYRGAIPIICCPHRPTAPLTINYKFVRKASQMCRQYAQPYYDSLRMELIQLDNEILNDMNQERLESLFPHAALVGKYKVKNIPEWLCGGTLISPNYILTAEHCTDNLRIVKMVADKSNKMHYIKAIYRYNDYYETNDEHDIALIELINNITFNDHIRPACIASQPEEDPLPQNAIVSGFGRINIDGSISEKLMAISIPIYEGNQCEKFTFRYKFKLNMKKSLCGGDAQSTKTTCMGDSGSPLELVMMPLSRVLGLVSTGLGGCAQFDSPTIYARISYYLDWIEDIVWT